MARLGFYLFESTRNGDLPSFLDILSTFPSPIERKVTLNSTDDNHWTLLHHATHCGHISIISWLLNQGRTMGFESVLARKWDGSTALHVAAEYKPSLSFSSSSFSSSFPLIDGELQVFLTIVNGCRNGNGNNNNSTSNNNSNSSNSNSYTNGNGNNNNNSNSNSNNNHNFNSNSNSSNNNSNDINNDTNGNNNNENDNSNNSNRNNNDISELQILLNAVTNGGWTVLHRAALKRNTSIISWLLSNEGRDAGFHNILAKSTVGTNALHVAVLDGQLETCKAIVNGCREENGERRAMLTAVDLKGWTLLHFAASNGHTSIVSWLLEEEEQGVGRIFWSDLRLAKTTSFSGEFNALFLAVEKGYLDTCQAIIRGLNKENGEREAMLNATDAQGNTVLHCAAKHNRLAIIKWLLEEEEREGSGVVSSATAAQEDTIMKEKSTAEIKAAEEATSIIVAAKDSATRKAEDTRMKEGADRKSNGKIQPGKDLKTTAPVAVDATMGKATDTNSTAEIQAASAAEDRMMVEEEATKSNTEMETAAEDSTTAEDKMATTATSENTKSTAEIATGNSNSDDSNHSSPNPRRRRFENILATSIEGDNALHTAAARGHLEACHLLVKSCHSSAERYEMLNAVNNEGYTVLHKASFDSHRSIIAWLLADNDFEDGDGMKGGRSLGLTSETVTAVSKTSLFSALHFVVVRVHTDSLNSFLSRCSSAERVKLLLARDRSGWTVLHHAVRHDLTDMIVCLMKTSECPMFVNSKDKHGMTALHRAVIGGVDKASRDEWNVTFQPNSSTISVLLLGRHRLFSNSDASQVQAAIDPNIPVGVSWL